MKNIITVVLLFLGFAAQAQLSIVNNNKPLGFLNPAFQNYEMDKGVVSASYVINPFIQDKNPGDYLVLGEFKVSDQFRVGVHGSKVENRLNASTAFKGYLSYKLELEKGSYLIFGADAGYYTDKLKTKEFNKVYAPNKFIYEDTTSTGLDVGVGVAYQYNQLMIGFGFSKLNKPQVYNFPDPFYDFYVDTIPVVGTDDILDTIYFFRDTTITTSAGQGNFGLQSNINATYEWDINDKLSLYHALHFGNVDLGGADFIGFQNILKFGDWHSVGAGVFYNGYTGFMLSGEYGLKSGIKLGVSTYFLEDLNYDIATSRYVNDGYKPIFEFNARYHF